MKNIFIGEDNLLEVESLTASATGAAVTGATVSFQLKDTAGTNIGSAVSASYVASNANGKPAYQGTLPASAATGLTAGKEYALWVNINTTQGVRKVRCIAKYHDEEC